MPAPHNTPAQTATPPPEAQATHPHTSAESHTQRYQSTKYSALQQYKSTKGKPRSQLPTANKANPSRRVMTSKSPQRAAHPLRRLCSAVPCSPCLLSERNLGSLDPTDAKRGARLMPTNVGGFLSAPGTRSAPAAHLWFCVRAAPLSVCLPHCLSSLSL